MGYLNKKGLAMEVIATLIILLVSFSVLFFIITEIWAPAANQTSKDYICRFSVLIASKTKTFGTKSPYDLKCNTEKLRLESDDKKEAMGFLADAMHHCWWKFGEGKLDFFSNWDVGFSDTECVVCSSIISEKGYKGDISFTEFGNYLNKEKPSFSEKTYAEKFSGVEGANFDFGGEGMIFINENKVNYVVFTINHYKGGIGQTAKDALKGLLGGFVGGAVIGSAIPIVGTSTVGTSTVAAGGTIVGFLGSFAYKGEYTPGLFILNGEEVVSKCKTLK